MKTFKLITGTILLTLMLFSCEYSITKEQNADSDGITIAEDEVLSLKAIEVTEEEAQAAGFSVDMGPIGPGGPGYGIGMGGGCYCGRFFPSCATVTVSSETYPKEIIVEFGEDCLDRFGNTRTGTIIITISDTLKNEGAVLTVEFDSVTFRNRLIERYMVMENLGPNEAGNWVMAIRDTATLHYGDSITSVRISEYEQEWLSGFGTPGFEDDVFYRTGGGTVTINDETVFTRTIIEPLLIDRSCGYIISGILEIVKLDNVMTIDFGDGTCDSEAVVTKDGTSEIIDLDLCRFKERFDRQNHKANQIHGWW